MVSRFEMDHDTRKQKPKLTNWHRHYLLKPSVASWVSGATIFPMVRAKLIPHAVVNS